MVRYAVIAVVIVLAYLSFSDSELGYTLSAQLDVLQGDMFEEVENLLDTVFGKADQPTP